MVRLLKTKKEFKKLYRQEIQIIFKRMILIKVALSMNIAYGKYKDLARSKELDKVLKDKAFTIASNPNYDGYQ